MNNDEYINFLDILADKSNSTLRENIKQGKLIPLYLGVKFSVVPECPGFSALSFFNPETTLSAAGAKI